MFLRLVFEVLLPLSEAACPFATALVDPVAALEDPAAALATALGDPAAASLATALEDPAAASLATALEDPTVVAGAAKVFLGCGASLLWLLLFSGKECIKKDGLGTTFDRDSTKVTRWKNGYTANHIATAPISSPKQKTMTMMIKKGHPLLVAQMKSIAIQVLQSTPVLHFQLPSLEPVWRIKWGLSKLFSSFLSFHHWFLVSLPFPSFHHLSKPFHLFSKLFLLLSKLFLLLPKTCPSLSSRGWIFRWPKPWCQCQLVSHCQPYGGSASRPCWFSTSKRELVFSNAWFAMIQCHKLWLTGQQCCQWMTLTWQKCSVPPPWRLGWRHQQEPLPKLPPVQLLLLKLWPLTVGLPSIATKTIPTWPNGSPYWFHQMRHRYKCWVDGLQVDFGIEDHGPWCWPNSAKRSWWGQWPTEDLGWSGRPTWWSQRPNQVLCGLRPKPVHQLLFGPLSWSPNCDSEDLLWCQGLRPLGSFSWTKVELQDFEWASPGGSSFGSSTIGFDPWRSLLPKIGHQRLHRSPRDPKFPTWLEWLWWEHPKLPVRQVEEDHLHKSEGSHKTVQLEFQKKVLVGVGESSTCSVQWSFDPRRGNCHLP